MCRFWEIHLGKMSTLEKCPPWEDVHIGEGVRTAFRGFHIRQGGVHIKMPLRADEKSQFKIWICWSTFVSKLGFYVASHAKKDFMLKLFRDKKSTAFERFYSNPYPTPTLSSPLNTQESERPDDVCAHSKKQRNRNVLFLSLFKSVIAPRQRKRSAGFQVLFSKHCRN